VGGELLRDVRPGEIVHLSHQKDIHSEMIIKSERTALCQFEYVYFARPDSIIDGVSVAQARLRMGRNLARRDPLLSDYTLRDNTIVVPVPDSARSAAVGYAKEAKLPYLEGLMKNRFVHRTFILPKQEERKVAVKEKLNPIKSVVKNKNIILVDDSLVRGTTMKQIVSLMKEAGAKSVHVRISCPPIIDACYMGIDFPTRDELIAGKLQRKENNYIESIRNKIGADTLLYQKIEDLRDAINLKNKHLCMACLTGSYPLKSIEKIKELGKTITLDRYMV
jgi:amidophosphoribosyltransferase